jgi:magnesium chelatase family protein
MLIKLSSVANIGIESICVDIEINIASGGLPKFNIVGLPSKAIEESKQRIVTAITNSGVVFPRKRITVNLAPADIPKEGAAFDLPIAVGILCGVLNTPVPEKSLFYGELSLDGNVRHTKGVFLLSLFAKEFGISNVYVPQSSVNEAMFVDNLIIHPVDNLKQMVEHLKSIRSIQSILGNSKKLEKSNNKPQVDISEIIDNQFAKRAIEVVAAGGHNIIMSGSPGAGKTMLARALSGILPYLDEREAIEVTKIYSATGNIPPNGSIISARPFRSPHHTTSVIGLIGGGSKPHPGEVSLAHRGVLFLDEFGEFPQYTLDALRQPIEDRQVSISRSKGHLTFPADFILVAATNPCPCGYLGHNSRECTCSQFEVSRYQKKISGPILDRIDLHVFIDPVPIEKMKLFSEEVVPSSVNECSNDILKRVNSARQIQIERFKSLNIHTNSEMSNRDLKQFANISTSANTLLLSFIDKFHLSTRTYFRMIKVARTIADLEGELSVESKHIAEAFQFRIRNQSGV